MFVCCQGKEVVEEGGEEEGRGVLEECWMSVGESESEIKNEGSKEGRE